MNFAELPPSKNWAPIKHRGVTLAEVWFKPEGRPFALTFRAPQTTFQAPGLGQTLSAAMLLKTVGIAIEEVESWHLEGTTVSAQDDPAAELGRQLPPPTPDVAHLTLHVCLKAPPHPVAPSPSAGPVVSEEKWQELEGRWNAILGLEATIDTLRISMESLQAELEGSSRRMLTAEEKVHALNSDVAQWNKAKSRVHHALPKLKEFIHRATWAAGTPERKHLEEIYRNHIQPRVPFGEMAWLVEQLDHLVKDRQVLSAQGVTAHQDGKSIAADIQGALRALQGGASANALKKRAATNPRGKPTF